MLNQLNAISKVLADQPDACVFPTIKLVLVDEIPFLHALVKQYRCITTDRVYPSTNGGFR